MNSLKSKMNLAFGKNKKTTINKKTEQKFETGSTFYLNEPSSSNSGFKASSLDVSSLHSDQSPSTSSQHFDVIENNVTIAIAEDVEAIIKRYKRSSTEFLKNFEPQDCEQTFTEINEKLKKEIFEEFSNLTDENRNKVIICLQRKEQEFYENYQFFVDFVANFNEYLSRRGNVINLEKFLHYNYDIPNYMSYHYITLEKCLGVLKSYKITSYRRYMRADLLKKINWDFGIENFHNVQEQISFVLKAAFDREMTKFTRVQKFYEKFRYELAQQLLSEAIDFEEEFKIIIDYHKSWADFYPDQVYFMNPIKLENKQDQVIEQLLEKYSIKGRHWYANVIKTNFQMLLNKNKRNFESELEVALELIQDKVQGEFEAYLKTGLFDEFQTWKLYKVLIDHSLENLKSFFDPDLWTTETLIMYQAKLINLLEQHSDKYTSKQKHLCEKVTNIQRKCCEQSVEMYLNLVQEEMSKSFEGFEGASSGNNITDENRENFLEEAINYSHKMSSTLKNDFNEEFYNKLLLEIRRKIKIQINSNKEEEEEKDDQKEEDQEQESEEKDEEKEWPKMEEPLGESSIFKSENGPERQYSEDSIYFSLDNSYEQRLSWSSETHLKKDLQTICSKLEELMRMNSNTPGILRLQIETEIKNTKDILESDDYDEDVYESQLNHLAKLYNLSI